MIYLWFNLVTVGLNPLIQLSIRADFVNEDKRQAVNKMWPRLVQQNEQDW